MQNPHTPTATAQPGAQLSTFSERAVADLGGAPWLADERLSAWARFDESTLPAETLEEWRYSRIDQLDLDRYAPLGAGLGAEVDVSAVEAVPDLPSATAGLEVPASTAALISALGTPAALVVVRDGLVVSVEGSCAG
ncbi:MAG: hypothetical protein ACRDYC_06970, partial [Acidimicrobiales bacterium]